jgi:hypothetical protein
MFGSYMFTPEEVVSLERFGRIPFLSSGIRIVHNRFDYPAKIIFWCLGSVNKLLARISEAGFRGVAPAESTARAKGFPVRWSAVVVLLILWNGLFLLDRFGLGNEPYEPGLAALVALAMVFFVAWGLRASEWLQGFVLREGHSIGEIKAPLLLLQLVSGALMVGFAVSYASRLHAG